MNSKNNIVIIGTVFILIISMLFFNLRSEYKHEYNTTQSEIVGINKISKIHTLDILLKKLRGISQIDNNIKSSFRDLSDDKLNRQIKLLNDEEIYNLYKSFLKQAKKLSQLEYFEKYTDILKLFTIKRLNIADNSTLLFESDREIYFLMSLSVSEIPRAIEHIAKSRGIGANILGNNNNNNNNNNLILLKSNTLSYLEDMEEIYHIISIIKLKESSQLSAILNTTDENFNLINDDINSIINKSSILTQKEYFYQVSELISTLNNLSIFSKELLLEKLMDRESDLNTKLLVLSFFYFSLIFIIIVFIYVYYNKINTELISSKKKKDESIFINNLRDDYSKSNNLKEICDKSINHIIHNFHAISGSLYLLDEGNSKLYLGSTYNISYSSIKHTLDLHENLISENIAEKEINITDINQIVNLGNIKTNCSKLVTIPILEFDKSIGTIQLVFDDKFNNVDIKFLSSVASLMATYIYKAQKENESKNYLNFIDKNVLMSRTDFHGNIIEVSEYLCKLSQYTKDEILGRNHRILRHPDMPKEIYKDLWQTIKKGNTWTGEIKNRKKDGGYYWIDSYITPDYDINGNITGYTAIRTDITDKKKIEEISITDGLTSLYNRRHFDTVFPQQIDIARRNKSLLVFVLMDIDNFKKYNDTYGHQDGDTTLKQVALALKDTLNRSTDYTFRLGGEEFGLLYFIENESDALDIATNAKTNVENLKIDHSGNTASKYVTISSGLYIIKENDQNSGNEIYKKSDEALYIAKESGRNRISVAS